MVCLKFYRMFLITVIKFLCACLSLSSKIPLRSLRAMAAAVRGAMLAPTASQLLQNPSHHCTG
uniref:Jumonji domain containing 1C n=1 Tax=Rousettus aegyptiacus TaxID=9407 RepID=A0A7J8GA35_ROUAE|nr:jumonji domain containing 1C [Rousettus aegyptiacus]